MGNIGCCDGSSGNGIMIRFKKQMFEVNGLPTESIKQIKAKISSRNQVSIRCIILTYNGMTLSDTQTLQQVDFDPRQDQLLLSISEENETSFTVTVRNISFSEKFEVKSTQKVKGLKKKIDRKFSIELSAQRLIFNGQVMADDEELDKYGISEGTVIHVAMILKH